MSNEIIDVEFKSKSPAFKRYIPLGLTLIVVLLDQLSKYLVELYIPFPVNEAGEAVVKYAAGATYFGDFLRIEHVCNPGIAFSMLNNLSQVFRWALLCIVPLIVLILVLCVFLRNKTFLQIQRWAIAGIIGGGFGNIIDRFFRADGVVDFISVKFYGLFGFERWPTFNVADMAIVVSGILLIVSFFFGIKKIKKEESK